MEEPWCLYLPLLELGYSSFAELVTEDREPAVIDTVELRRRHVNKVKDIHKLALNKLIVLVTNASMNKRDLAKAISCTRTGPRKLCMRKVNNPAFTEMCAHITRHLYHDAISYHERSAVADLLGTNAPARERERELLNAGLESVV